MWDIISSHIKYNVQYVESMCYFARPVQKEWRCTVRTSRQPSVYKCLLRTNERTIDKLRTSYEFKQSAYLQHCPHKLQSTLCRAHGQWPSGGSWHEDTSSRSPERLLKWKSDWNILQKIDYTMCEVIRLVKYCIYNKMLWLLPLFHCRNFHQEPGTTGGHLFRSAAGTVINETLCMNSFQRLRNFWTEATVLNISGGIHIFSHVQLRKILFRFILYIFILSIAVFHSYWSQLHSRRTSVVLCLFLSRNTVVFITFSLLSVSSLSTTQINHAVTLYSTAIKLDSSLQQSSAINLKISTFSDSDSEEINRTLPVSFWLWKQKADLSSIIKDIFWLFSVLYKLTAVFLRKSL